MKRWQIGIFGIISTEILRNEIETLLLNEDKRSDDCSGNVTPICVRNNQLKESKGKK